MWAMERAPSSSWAAMRGEPQDGQRLGAASAVQKQSPQRAYREAHPSPSRGEGQGWGCGR
jgi:hypothetical protein